MTVDPPGDPAVLPPAGAETAKPPDQPADAGKSTDASKPATAGSLAASVPLELAPATLSVITTAVAAPPVAPVPAPTHSDPQVLRTSAESPTHDSTERRRLTIEPGVPVARVGDEIITYHDLVHAVRENLSNHPRPPGFDTAGRLERHNYLSMAYTETLENLIDRCLLVQEAKRNIKDKKMLDQVYEKSDEMWHVNEILPLDANTTWIASCSSRKSSRQRAVRSMQ